jgi:CTP synthase (UTP-ammonia lyase)
VTTIAILGDFDAKKSTHLATDAAVTHCAAALGLPVEPRWVATEELAGPDSLKKLAGCKGFWIAPGGPYRNREGVLAAIRLARERQIPLLGTCGGFQHIILEYARNVLGLADAEHEETTPGAARCFISRLSCSLAGRTLNITLRPDSLVARAYGRTEIQEQYLCNFGVNPDYEALLGTRDLLIVGSDKEGVVRVVELAQHPFFVGTLFVPQMISTPEFPHPLIAAFVKACAAASA